MREKPRILNIKIQAKSSVPVYEQVKQAVKRLIVSGYLVKGDQLMSIRELALRLRVHPNTIVKVYSQMEYEGYIQSRPGSGYFVAGSQLNIEKERSLQFEQAAGDYILKSRQLGYGRREIWRQIIRLTKTVSADVPEGEDHDPNQ